jgi:hypothetical protein
MSAHFAGVSWKLRDSSATSSRVGEMSAQDCLVES